MRWVKVLHRWANVQAKLCTYVVGVVEGVLIMCVRSGVRLVVTEKLLR
jgi:hypothetical protein